MSMHLLVAAALASLPGGFAEVSGFMDLDACATPNGFGLLLVGSGDTGADSSFAEELVAAVEALPDPGSVDLYVIMPDEPGYRDVAALTGEYGEPPSVVCLVGHCGFLELDPSFLEGEVVDSWYVWGDPDCRRTGICNFCTRCNP